MKQNNLINVKCNGQCCITSDKIIHVYKNFAQSFCLLFHFACHHLYSRILQNKHAHHNIIKLIWVMRMSRTMGCTQKNKVNCKTKK